MSKAARYLGYAFAGADLVFEIGVDGTIAEPLGAARHLTGHDVEGLSGRSWLSVFAEADRAVLDIIAGSLRAGERRGPLRAQLEPVAGRRLRRFVSLCLFRSPVSGGAVSAAVSLTSAPEPLTRRETAEGLWTGEGLAEALDGVLSEARAAGLTLSIELVEVPGLEASRLKLDDSRRDELKRRLAAALRAGSYRAEAAAEVGPDQFAVVTEDGGGVHDLSAQIDAIVQDFGIAAASRRSGVALPPELSPDQTARALRHAIQTFTAAGPESAATGLKQALKSTLERGEAFRAVVEGGAFRLVYQPVVSLAGGAVHHFEALARLDGEVSPADAVKLAEDLNMIQDFDDSVARVAIEALARQADPSLRIAINVSAVSLEGDAYGPMLLRRMRQSALHPSQILVELTETSPVANLDAMAARIAALRAAGVQVCLDDVGAGAASLDYMRRLPLDFVKLDGRFTVDVLRSEATCAVVRNLARMAAELGADMIAEHVETEANARRLVELGVRLGQGWLFGKGGPLPEKTGQGETARLASRPARKIRASVDWL